MCKKRETFLCYIGKQWYNDFMLRKFSEYNFYPFTRSTIEKFKGWENNYDEYSKDVLPDDETTRPDFILIDNTFFVNRRRVFGHDSLYNFIKKDSYNFTIPVIGIDHCDVILSKYLPEDIDCFDLVLKGQGLPKDRDLMNWEIGVRWGLNRKNKIRRLRFKDWILSKKQIDKFKLSFDLGTAAFCDHKIKPLPTDFEWWDVFLVAMFNSINRLEALKICKDNFRTFGHLIKLPTDNPITGINSWMADPDKGRKEDRRLLIELTEKYYRKNKELFKKYRIPSYFFKILASFSKIMPAFSGIGELGMRNYQALAFGKLHLCEDLSYIETIYPFCDGENSVFVDDHLENLEEKVCWFLENKSIRQSIALKGCKQMQTTYRNGNSIFENFFLNYLGLS